MRNEREREGRTSVYTRVVVLCSFAVVEIFRVESCSIPSSSILFQLRINVLNCGNKIIWSVKQNKSEKMSNVIINKRKKQKQKETRLQYRWRDYRVRDMKRGWDKWGRWEHWSKKWRDSWERDNLRDLISSIEATMRYIWVQSLRDVLSWE
jgi:hypothetical protein